MTDPAPTASRLRPCPRRPNCVSTQADPEDPKHMDPIPYQGTLAQARERLLAILRGYPRTRVVQDDGDYLHAECRSKVFRFVDDVEFQFDDTAKHIRFRSAARLGYRDFGVNRNRMEEITRLFTGRDA